MKRKVKERNKKNINEKFVYVEEICGLEVLNKHLFGGPPYYSLKHQHCWATLGFCLLKFLSRQLGMI